MIMASLNILYNYTMRSGEKVTYQPCLTFKHINKLIYLPDTTATSMRIVQCLALTYVGYPAGRNKRTFWCASLDCLLRPLRRSAVKAGRHLRSIEQVAFKAWSRQVDIVTQIIKSKISIKSKIITSDYPCPGQIRGIWFRQWIEENFLDF